MEWAWQRIAALHTPVRNITIRMLTRQHHVLLSPSPAPLLPASSLHQIHGQSASSGDTHSRYVGEPTPAPPRPRRAAAVAALSPPVLSLIQSNAQHQLV